MRVFAKIIKQIVALLLKKEVFTLNPLRSQYWPEVPVQEIYNLQYQRKLINCSIQVPKKKSFDFPFISMLILKRLLGSNC